MENTENKIIVVEGPDASGKSTLLNQLMEKYRNHIYIHNAVCDDIKLLHTNTIKLAVAASKTHYVFIDRLHWSEEVYGTLFREGPSYNILKFENEVINKIPNLVKIFCHVKKETCCKKHDERLEKEMYKSNERVWEMYNTIIPHFGFENWIQYNWETDDFNFDTFEVTKKV